MEKMMAILNRFSEMFEEISTWRRDLHAHPELRFEEYRTAEHCQTKRGWDGAGGFVASPYDKTLPIQVL